LRLRTLTTAAIGRCPNGYASPRRSYEAARLARTLAIIAAAKRKWQLTDPVRVVVMYEAGQEGFWICRAPREAGCEALVVDPASIPVERHAWRARTDRLG
jgi:transposase